MKEIKDCNFLIKNALNQKNKYNENMKNIVEVKNFKMMFGDKTIVKDLIQWYLSITPYYNDLISYIMTKSSFFGSEISGTIEEDNIEYANFILLRST